MLSHFFSRQHLEVLWMYDSCCINRFWLIDKTDIGATLKHKGCCLLIQIHQLQPRSSELSTTSACNWVYVYTVRLCMIERPAFFFCVRLCTWVSWVDTLMCVFLVRLDVCTEFICFPAFIPLCSIYFSTAPFHCLCLKGQLMSLYSFQSKI